jgi:phosphotransferase system HPr-like phosphotransfer protein
MISFKCRLEQNITGRAAAQLNWAIKLLKSNIRVINKDGRMIDGKSLVGLLSGQMKIGDLITISFDKKEEEQKIKSCFKELGLLKEV